MLCKNCTTEHDSSYGSGVFCSSKCARSFSTKAKRQEINQAVSSSLKGRKSSFTDEHRRKAGITKRQNRLAKIITLDWDFLPKNARRKRILHEQHHLCAVCSITQIWNNLPLGFQLDHVNGDRANNSRENLRMICPNCHTQTSTYCSKNVSAEGKERMKAGGRKSCALKLGRS